MLYKDKSLQIVITCISLIHIKEPVLFVFKCSTDSLHLNTSDTGYYIWYIIYEMMVLIVVGTACWYNVHTIYNIWIFITSNQHTSLVLLYVARNLLGH